MIVHEEAVIVIAGDGIAELLHGPQGCRMFGYVAVQNSARAELQQDEYIKDAEADRYGNEEVASDNSTGMVPDERRPPLILAAVRTWRLLDVFPNRMW